MVAIELPYFACSECQLVYIDKNLLREIISTWRKTSGYEFISQKELYQQMLAFLEEHTNYLCQNAGYKRVRFKKAEE